VVVLLLIVVGFIGEGGRYNLRSRGSSGSAMYKGVSG
jgi:hypothetical protein